MSLVQKYLSNHSLEDLEREHSVKSRIDGYKASLNYNQIEASDHDLLAQECRGLVITCDRVLLEVDGSLPTNRPLGSVKILARPFNRFFNLGQPAAAPVALESPDTFFFEKLDGTLTILYHDSVIGKWCVATRSVSNANLPIDGFGHYTFRTLFEKACKDTTGFDFDAFVTQLDPFVTYLFELTTPLNRIVVDYKDYRITLLGARDNSSGAELDLRFLADKIGVPHPRLFKFGSVKDMVDFVATQAPQEHEGIVVCDKQFHRVKVKSPGYLALNRVRDSVLSSPRALVELILLEKLDDALPILPAHIQTEAIKLCESFAKFVRSHRENFEECIHDVAKWNEEQGWAYEFTSKEHRKVFALAVQDRKGWMSPMIDQYSGKSAGLIDWLQKRRNDDGSWPNGLLDTILKQIQSVE